MYICPTCAKELPTEQEIVKHFLFCWKGKNPNHKSKSASHTESTNIQVNSDILVFFAQFGENNYES